MRQKRAEESREGGDEETRKRRERREKWEERGENETKKRGVEE